MKLKLTTTYELGDARFEDEVVQDVTTDGDVEKAFYTLHRKHRKTREICMKLMKPNNDEGKVTE